MALYYNIRDWTMSPSPYLLEIQPNAANLTKNMTLIGHSRAMEKTCLWIPEFNWCLDAGFSAPNMPTMNRVFLSHAHLDHSNDLHLLIRRHGDNNKAIDVYSPMATVPYAQNFIHSITDFNYSWPMSHTLSYVMHPVKSGHSFNLDHHFKMKIIECEHSVPTVGFLFYQIREKLKKEYHNLSGKELANLKKQGIIIDEEHNIAVFAFLGDTTHRVFNQYPELLEFPIIIVECTYLYAEHLSQSITKLHTHWDYLQPIVNGNRQCMFVLIHFSLRYDDEDVYQFFEQEKKRHEDLGLPPLDNIIVWVSDDRRRRWEYQHERPNLNTPDQSRRKFDGNKSPAHHLSPLLSPKLSATIKNLPKFPKKYNDQVRKQYGNIV